MCPPPPKSACAATACCTLCGGSCDCPVPHCLDRSLVRTSERTLCRVELTPDTMPASVGVPTSWTVRLIGPGERPLDDARVSVDGGMPQHGHGFPATPVVSSLGAGHHRIAGVVFTARGWWVLRLTIDAAPDTDDVTFNLVI